jgi:tetraacyldisaccharide 4'-kinase
VWVHAASVGEVQAAVGLVQAIRARRPRWETVITTQTATARRWVREKWPEMKAYLVPLDFPWMLSRVYNRIRPKLILIVETELWPNLIWQAVRRDVPAVLVSGRLSPKRLRRYSAWGWLYRPVLNSLDWIGVQSEQEAERFRRAGAQRVEVTGNLKLDLLPKGLTAQQRESMFRSLGLTGRETMMVAGSTHPGEEEIVLSAFEEVHKQHPDLRLILAPRHIERLPEIEPLLKNRGIPYSRRSQGGRLENDRPVLLLDTMGELRDLYGLASVAVVGGTFVPVGGHNLLEPAAYGCPVLYGPHTDHVQDQVELLRDIGIGKEIKDSEEFIKIVKEILSLKGDALGSRERTMGLLDRQRGATDRTVARLLPHLTDRHDERPGYVCLWERQQKETGTPATSIVGPILRPLSWIYHVLVRLRTAGYEIGLLRPHRLPVPVVSVGNIEVGGTGKTPMVIELARWCIRRGFHPAVVSRGYGGSASATNRVMAVSDRNRILVGPEVGGDEPVLIAQKLPGLPVVVGRDRLAAARLAIERFGPDVLILDDGFQHRSVHRDLDLVMLSPEILTQKESLLPAGRLREPIAALRRADAVVTIGETIPDSVPDALRRLRVKRWFRLDRQSFGLRGLGHETDWTPRPAAAVCGIARPEGFMAALCRAGIETVSAWWYADHHPFTSEEIRDLERRAVADGATDLITTEKDAVRIAGKIGQGVQWWVVPMAITADETEKEAWESFLNEAILKKSTRG